jgi:hypothetical protein
MILIRLVEIRSDDKKPADGLLGHQPLVATILVLGYAAVLLNLILCTSFLISVIRNKPVAVTHWLKWSSFLFLAVQLLYFFGGN